MAILEKEVWVGINHMNADYYEKQGYTIPKVINKRGKLVPSNNKKILVNIKDLQETSNVKLIKVCDDCGKHSLKPQSYNAITKQRKEIDSKDRCRNCGNLYKWKVEKENVPYERSLEYYAKENDKEYLLEEFSDKNPFVADKVFKASNDMYLWNCSICKSEYPARVNNRINDRNCPYCTGRKVNHTNCLWTTNPNVAKLLKYEQRGFEVTAGTDKKEEFVCSDCSHIMKKSVQDVVKSGFLCSKCSDGISYPEKFMFNMLSQLGMKFETQKIFKWSNMKRYDFYIPSLNCIIETHGSQHYNGNFISVGGKSLEEEQETDELKQNLAINNNVENYIVINCARSEYDYIKTKIKESKLKLLLDLKKVDWLKCHEYSCSTIVKKVCDLWNEGTKSVLEIGKIVKLERPAIRKYLKQGEKLGWTEYNARKELIKTVSSNGKKSAKQVVQLSKNGEYIKTWDSFTEVEMNLGLFSANISKVCNGQRNHTGGFKWIRKEDYEKNKGIKQN